jgi:hypothetical protein
MSRTCLLVCVRAYARIHVTYTYVRECNMRVCVCVRMLVPVYMQVCICVRRFTL